MHSPAIVTGTMHRSSSDATPPTNRVKPRCFVLSGGFLLLGAAAIVAGIRMEDAVWTRLLIWAGAIDVVIWAGVLGLFCLAARMDAADAGSDAPAKRSTDHAA